MTATATAEYLPSQRARWAGGQPISQLMAHALQNPDLISLAVGFVDQETLPASAAAAAWSSLFQDPHTAAAALQYGTTPGHLPLREQLLARTRHADAADPPLALEQIVVTAGSNQLLQLVSESLLDPGDIVLCAAPTYFVYLGLVAGLGARAVGVASDAAGMIPDALEETLARCQRHGDLPRVKAVYLVPYFDNPAATTVPAPRRAAIVELAKRWSKHGRIHVISDEAYRELRYAGEDLPSPRVWDEEGDTVIVAGSFSKSFSPGIRVGWGLLPRHLIGPVNDQKGNADFGSPNLNQYLMARVLELGLWEPHLARIRSSYSEKLKAMLAAADLHLARLPGVEWHRPQGGLYVWVRLPGGLDAGLDGPLFDAAVREGVLYVPGEYCYPAAGEPVQRNSLRLSFGVQSCAKIREGVEKLARALRAAG
ncbi:MAG: PLP-dependent aminotransferase family protein [Candidatus Anammoximicrobium sp.]|nr:PLP-dependent aminotransferase family protein [Candidatus Anammoximicrobium sp.]